MGIYIVYPYTLTLICIPIHMCEVPMCCCTYLVYSTYIHPTFTLYSPCIHPILPSPTNPHPSPITYHPIHTLYTPSLSGDKFSHRLVKIDRPILRIPNLCIHLQSAKEREVLTTITNYCLLLLLALLLLPLLLLSSSNTTTTTNYYF
jgi:hypothetical protein